MALLSARLRRTLASLSSLRRSLHSPVIHSSPPIPRSLISSSPSVSLLFQLRSFTGSPVSLSSSGRQYKLYKEGDEITEDTVLFEGCDFNHWLITVDFPKDPAPTPEEMVATYERICAQGLNISIEEAKQKMYACSTTTYNGFQAVMTEEESKRFEGVPGVVFVLPDSYIDPQNKQYGGDKYENGLITPRPPPYEYRKSAGRFNDRNRNPSQPRYDQRGGPAPNQGGNPQYNQQGYRQGSGNYRAPQSYLPPNQGGNPQYNQQYGTQQIYPPLNQGGSPQYNQQGYPQGSGSYGAQQSAGHYGDQQSYSPQGGDKYGTQQSNTPQVGGSYGAQQSYPSRQSYGPPGENRDVSYQGHQGGHYPQDQRENRDVSYKGYYNQGHQGGHYPQDQRDFSLGTQEDFSRRAPNFSPGTQGQNANTGYRQGYPVEGQNFSPMDQRQMHVENSPPPIGHTGTNQVRD